MSAIVTRTATITAPPPLELLIAACRQSNTARGHQLLRSTDVLADVNAVGVDGDTPLIAVCRYGHRTLVKILAELGVNVNATNADGWMPLCIAAWNGQMGIVSELLSRGASVATTNAEG